MEMEAGQSNGKTTSEQTEAAAAAAAAADGLLKWTQVPTHLKFNPYIHNGYRPLASSTGCIKSLGYFHNETINILTHGNTKTRILTLLLHCIYAEL